jgi:hypothetical protein
MPNIPFPNVPAFPGVPVLTRPVSVAIARSPALAIGIGTVENLLIQALQQTPQWGIFDAAGNQLGVNSNNSNSILSALASQVTGASSPVLSTVGVDFVKEMRVSDFPVETGSFASYNKVETPDNPVVTLALAGSEDDRTYFLNAIDAACKSTNLYDVVTPTVTYVNYTIERYTYSRRASKGATLLIVEVSLKKIRQVTATFARVTAPIVSPQNTAATPQVNNGMTQPSAPDTSTLKSIVNKIPALAGTN